MRIRIIPNIFDKQGRQTHEVSLREPKKLSSLILEDVPECYHEGWKAVSSSQGFVRHEDWPRCLVRDNDEIILTPEVQDPISIGIAIGSAIASAASWAAGALAAISPFLALAGTAYGLYTAFGAKKPGQGGDDESPTYGWAGIQNTASPDAPIAIVYGKTRLGGNYVNVFLETDAAENKHYLNVLIALCCGPVQSVAGLTENTDDADIEVIGDDILIDGNPISNFNEAKVSVRLGLDQQLTIYEFHKIHDLHGTSFELHPGDTIEYTTTGTTVENIELQILFPQGLYGVHASRGHLHPQSATIQLWYRVHGGDPAWIECTEHERVPTARTSSPLRTSYLIYGLPGGQQYDIKIRSKPQTEDSEHVCHFTITGFDEITFDPRQYPYTALLAIRLLATSQISGSLPTITTIVEGLKVDVWNGAAMVNQYSRNPIWCLRDLIMNVRHGVGRFMALSSMDNDELKVEADYCDELVGASGEQDVRFRMDVIIDTVGKAFDLINQLALGFQGMILYSAGRIKLLIDRPSHSSQQFTMGSIVEGSFRENFLSKREVPTKMEVQFFNEAKDFERDITEPTLVGIETPVATDPVRAKTLWLPGVTRVLQAIRLARYVFRMTRYCTRLIDFRVGIDGVACQAGDKIEFAHDVPFWGVRSGRLKSSFGGAPSEYVTLYEYLEIPSGETYYIRVRMSDDTLQTREITSPAGVYAPGDKIYIDGAWSPLPQTYDPYSVGKHTILTKPFRVLALEVLPKHEVQITALETFPAVYDESDLIEPPRQYSDLPDPRRHPRHVEDLSLRNSYTYDATVYVSFTIPASTGIVGERGVILTYALHDHAEIWLATFSSPSSFYKHGETGGTTYELRNLIPGVRYYVKVVAVSLAGIAAPFDTAPVASILVHFALPFPSITGLELKGQGLDPEFAGRDAICTWHEYSRATTDWPAGDEPLGAGQGTRDLTFDCYQIEIWDYDGTVKVRTEEVRDNEYTYSFEKNNNDNRLVIRGQRRALIHRGDQWAKRMFRIKVRAKDIFNNLSEPPAVLKVFNAYPTAPTDITISDNLGTVRLDWAVSHDKDMKEYWVFRGEETGFLPPTGDFMPDPESPFLVYRGWSSAFVDHVPDAETEYFYRIAAIDDFGPHELSVSNEISSKVLDPVQYLKIPCYTCWPGARHQTPSGFTVNFYDVLKCADDQPSQINGRWTFDRLPGVACVYWCKGIVDGKECHMFLDMRDDIPMRPNTTKLWAYLDTGGGTSGAAFETAELSKCSRIVISEPNVWGIGDCGVHPEQPGNTIDCYGGTVDWTPIILPAFLD